MAIPDFQTIMLPLLAISSDGQEHLFREATDAIAQHFRLTEDERKELLPSGRQKLLTNRVGWARFYMVKAGLLETVRRGYFRITDRGLDVLSQKPDHIDRKFLEQFGEFRDFKALLREKSKEGPASPDARDVRDTPEETVEAAHQQLRDDLAAELLQTVMECSPGFFERLVIDLLVNMGYGGTRKDAGAAIGQSGDGGIDGIIKEDRLGLDIVYVQAKRWGPDNTVGRPEIQKFAGALQGHRARKGVFLATSSFSKEALDYVSHIDSKIVLIDGDQLSQLMIDYGIGVSLVATYELKRIDSDYFVEE